jgi:hypothetical protein
MKKVKLGLLKEYIKNQIKQLIKEEEQSMMPTVYGGQSIADERKKLHLLNRLPILRKALETLLSTAFEQYITDISLEAPKPTTFKVTLSNGIPFYLIYNGGPDNKKFDLRNGNFTAQIAGKKYDLSTLSQAEQATQKMSQQLTLMPQSPENNQQSDPGQEMFGSPSKGGGGGNGGPGNFPGQENNNTGAGIEGTPENPNPASAVGGHNNKGTNPLPEPTNGDNGEEVNIPNPEEEEQ